MRDTIFPALLFFAALAGTQYVGRRAHAQLTPEQKLAVMDSSPKVPWNLIVMALLFGLQSWLSERLGHPAWITGAFMIALLLVVVGSSILMMRRLKSLNLPPRYINTLASTQIFVLACLVFMFWSTFSNVREIFGLSTKALEESRAP